MFRFDHGGFSLAIYRLEDDRFFAIGGFCTHHNVHLANGLVLGEVIECPKHNGRFDITAGRALGAPACINLKTYPVKVEAGRVFVELD